MAAHDHSVDDAHGGAAHGTYKSYLTGFVLALILTAIPFALVMTGALPASVTVPVILILAVVQIVVHLVYFLHLSTASSQLWNVSALIFAAIIVAITVIGSIWIMSHLDAHAMRPTLRQLAE